MWLLGSWTNTGYTLMTGCWLLALRSLTKRAPAERAPAEPSAGVAAGPIGAGVWPPWAEASLLSLFLASSFTNHLAWSPQAGGERVGAFQLTSLGPLDLHTTCGHGPKASHGTRRGTAVTACAAVRLAHPKGRSP